MVELLALVTLFVVAPLLVATRRRLGAVERSLAAINRRLASEDGGEERPEEEAVGPESAPAPQEPEQPEEPAQATGWGQAASAPRPPEGPQTEEPQAEEPAKAAFDRGGFEQQIGTRWVVWVGGLMLALGGIFLVRYSIEQGYFGPTVRVVLGGLLSLVLLAVGEKLRRAPSMRDIANLPSTAIAPILTGTGIITGFATIFSAYALYDMVGPVGAFILLAGLSLASVFLSVLHGPALAMLGLIGSFVTPALVSTDDPSSISLFTYLAFVTVAALVVVRLRSWWGIGFATLGGAAVWPLLWFASAGDVFDDLVLALYLPFMAAAFCEATGILRSAQDVPATHQPRQQWLAYTAVGVAGFLMIILLPRTGYNTEALAGLGLYAASSLFMAYRHRTLDIVAAISGGFVVLGLAAWVPVPVLSFEETDAAMRGFLTAQLLPQELQRYLIVTGLFGALYAGTGYLLLARIAARGLWASVSTAVPVVLFAAVYWRATAMETSIAWGAVGAVLALGASVAAEQVRRRAGDWNGAIGAYATGAIAAIALGLGMALRDGWLTVSLSAMLPAIAWLNRPLLLPVLRIVAAILASIVMVRLALNPSLLAYDISATPFFNMMLYTYGVPAIAFWYAANWFRAQGDGPVVQILEAGTALIVTLFVTLQLNHWMNDGVLFDGEYGLAQQAVQSLAWLSLSLGFYRIARTLGRKMFSYAAALLRWLGLAQVMFGHLLFNNPMFTGDPVGESFVFNQLLLAYAAPALLTLIYYFRARAAGDRVTAVIFGVATLVLGFAYLSFQVRHGFHGSILERGVTTDGEWYAYSLVWLLYGAALFIAGFRFGGRELRLAAFAVITFAIAKAFLFDMSNLDGILRAASFLGFGVMLILIGLLYQKYIFPQGSAPKEAVSDG